MLRCFSFRCKKQIVKRKSNREKGGSNEVITTFPTAYIGIRVPMDVKVKLSELATLERRSLSSFAALKLEQICKWPVAN
jgi:hypothetical protein